MVLRLHAVHLPSLIIGLLAFQEGSEPFQARFGVRGRWSGERSISYRLEDDQGALAPRDFERAITAALDEWTATGCATFRAAGSAEDADLVFAWRRGAHEDCEPFGADTSIAHAGPVGPGTFVHFDADRRWSIDGEDGLSLRAAALHEVGHALGLEHSPDEHSLLHPEPSSERGHLGPSDLAAIHSLYGGGEDGSGDLVITTGGALATVLRSVAPRAISGWGLFDCDGDGDHEVLVWRTDRAGSGALWSFHFERSPSGPRLARTIGPLYGVSTAAGSLSFGVAPGGERLLWLSVAEAPRLLRVFDAHGLPQAPPEELSALSAPLMASGPSSVGDLDGDGVLEEVFQRP